MSSTMVRKVALLALLGLLWACPRPSTGQGVPRVEVKPDARADAALAQATAVLGTRPHQEGIDALLSVRRQFPESTAGQEALFRAGALAFQEGDYATARKALSELVFENPLHPNAREARLKSGLAAVELKAYRDAWQTLSSLVDQLEGQDRQLAEEALRKAGAGSQQYTEVLRRALRQVETASEVDRAQALVQLESVVESQTTFLSIAEAWNDLPTTHPAWPLLTFKMARVYYHLRDWRRLDETLKSLLHNAPASPFATDARDLLERVSRRAEVKPKVLGAVLPMSGKYRQFGEVVERALQLALKGSDLELMVKDSQGDPTLTGRQVEELAFDVGVIAIIGPLLTDDSRRAALVAEELQVPLITLSRAEGITDLGPHIFRTMVTNRQEAAALADYAMGTLGYKTFGVLYPNSSFGKEFTDAFWDEIEKRGGEMRAAESYSHDQTTFTSEAKKLVGRYYLEDRADYHEKVREIRESIRDEFRRRKAVEKMRGALDPVIDFEALLLPDKWERVSLVAPALAVEDIITNACDKKDLERIQKTTGKEKLKTVTLLGPNTWSSQPGTNDLELVERGGKYVLCSLYVDGFYQGSERAQTRAFVNAFQEAYGTARITTLHAVAYDTAAMLRQVVERSQPQTRSSFREQLSQLRGFEGATGTISFDDRREARRPLFLLNITPKGVKELAPRKPEG